MGRKFEDDIARELHRERATPSDGFVRSLANSVRPAPQVRTGRRLAVAFALSMLGVLALSVTAGTTQPLAAPKAVADVVQKAVTAPQATPTKPVVRPQPTTGRATATPTITASRSASTTARGKAAAMPAQTTTPALRPTTVVALVDESPANDQYEGAEGCSPGFWKNHSGSYPSGVTSGSTLASVGFVGTGTTTFDQALTEGGGAVDALLRHAAAAYLNALSVDFPISAAQVVSMTNDALATSDADVIEALKDTFDTWNNLGAGLCD